MSTRPRHRARPPRSRRIAKRALATVGIVMVVLATAIVVVIKHLEGNITAVDVTGDLGNRPAAVVKGPINVLVMGDDTRKGQGPQIGGTTPGLSDTTILLHLSANRKNAYGISIPRDSMVQRPSCVTTNGTDAGGLTQFNAAYAIGGPACTIKTVESLTHVRIDHFIVIKFKGFRKMVDAIGGVDVCVPQQIDDPQSNIHLPPGTYKVTGEQALNYVRVRHGVGDGSDIGRMKRQQSFIASMINKVVSAGTLANPVRLYNFLNEATKSLITDPGFSHLGQLVSLGSAMKNIGLDHVKFLTVPFEPYSLDKNRIQWAPQADELWQAIRFDRRVGADLTGGAIDASHTPGTKPGSSASPSAGSSPSSTSSPSSESTAAANSVGLCG